MAEWKKNYLTLQETHFSFKDTYRLKVKEWKKIFREKCWERLKAGGGGEDRG